VGVFEQHASMNVLLYPNPTSKAVSITASVDGFVAVMDQAGRKILDQIRITPNSTISIDTTEWSEGMYQVVVSGSAGTAAVRLLKVN